MLILMLKRQNTNHQNKQKEFRFSTLVCGVALSFLSSTILHAEVSDIQINALVSQAIKTHPLINAAKADRNATVEGVSAAKLNLFPVPSILSSHDNNSDQLVTNVSIQQPLWTGGGLTATINKAIFDDKAAIETVYEQQNKVAKNTIDAWQSYITAVGLQGVYNKNLKQLDEFESMMKRRVSQGVSARIELDLINNRILQEQNNLQGASEQQRIAAARIQQMIGQRVAQSSPINTNLLGKMVKQAKQDAASFENLAFSDISFYNPSVVKAGYKIEAAKEEVKSKKAAVYPNIYAKYDYSYYHKDGTDDNQFSIGLAYNPGAGFSNFALARASESRVNSLIQSQEASRRTVMEDIQTQYQQFASTVDQERSLVAAIAGAQIVVDSYRRQFKAGRKSWLDVLNAIRELGGYKTELVNARTEMLGAYHKLQVDFGLMPWQQFYQNRMPTERFNPINGVSDLFSSFSENITAKNELEKTALPVDQIAAVSGQPTTNDILNTEVAVEGSVDESTLPPNVSVGEQAPVAVEDDSFKKQMTNNVLTDTAVPFEPNEQDVILEETERERNLQLQNKITNTNNLSNGTEAIPVEPEPKLEPEPEPRIEPELEPGLEPKPKNKMIDDDSTGVTEKREVVNKPKGCINCRYPNTKKRYTLPLKNKILSN